MKLNIMNFDVIVFLTIFGTKYFALDYSSNNSCLLANFFSRFDLFLTCRINTKSTIFVLRGCMMHHCLRERCVIILSIVCFSVFSSLFLFYLFFIFNFYFVSCTSRVIHSNAVACPNY